MLAKYFKKIRKVVAVTATYNTNLPY